MSGGYILDSYLVACRPEVIKDILVRRRVEVHKDRLVIVPVVGEPEVDPR